MKGLFKGKFYLVNIVLVGQLKKVLINEMGLGKGDVLLLLPLSLFTTPPMTSSQLLCLCQHGGCRDSLSLLHSKDIVTNKCEHYFEALFAFLGGSMLWTKSNGLACFQDLDIPLFANQG